MEDFDKTIEPGDIKNGFVNVVVEIPVGGLEKIEWNRERKAMEIDRQEPMNFALPTNYGFIPQTLNDDSDALDVLALDDNPIKTGTSLPAKIIGIMKFDDEGVSDDKILVVKIENNSINSMDDIPKSKIDQLTHYFNHYKDSKKLNCTRVGGWAGIEEAKKAIIKSISLWKN